MSKKAENVSRGTQQLKALGRAFHMARLDLGLTIDQLELKCHISNITISKLERGKLENTSFATLCAIGEALGVPVEFKLP